MDSFEKGSTSLNLKITKKFKKIQKAYERKKEVMK